MPYFCVCVCIYRSISMVTTWNLFVWHKSNRAPCSNRRRALFASRSFALVCTTTQVIRQACRRSRSQRARSFCLADTTRWRNAWASVSSTRDPCWAWGPCVLDRNTPSPCSFWTRYSKVSTCFERQIDILVELYRNTKINLDRCIGIKTIFGIIELFDFIEFYLFVYFWFFNFCYNLFISFFWKFVIVSNNGRRFWVTRVDCI